MHSIFYILLFTFTTLLAFSTNLHLLSFLQIDTAKVLDIKEDHKSTTLNSNFVNSSRLYPPLYKLGFLGLTWTLAGWAMMRWCTGGEDSNLVSWRGIPALTGLGVLVGLVVPMNVLFRKERYMFLRCMKRIMFSPLNSVVPFCDIIFADILTSSSKWLGDIWVSSCSLFQSAESITESIESGEICAREWMVPIMTSLPYIFRFRQCISEIVTGSTPTPRKSVLNAIKYASAFPVIIFSAMQTVVGDPFDEDIGVAENGAWIGRNNLFKLWVLAVLINSLYSFWWDVTNDWGLSLLTPAGWSSAQSYSSIFQNRTSRSRPSEIGGPSLMVPGASDSIYPPPPSRPQSPGDRNPNAKSYHRPTHSRAYSTAATPNVTYPFLRPILLLPDPTIYYLAILIDLLLRFTWSLKLSSHLHSIQEIEGGIFLMESLEVLRRWMWVYLRLEWEAVRKGGGGNREDGKDVEESIGLGILVKN